MASTGLAKAAIRFLASIAVECQYAFRRERFANRLGNTFSYPIEIIRLSGIKKRKYEEIIGKRRNRRTGTRIPRPAETSYASIVTRAGLETDPASASHA